MSRHKIVVSKMPMGEYTEGYEYILINTSSHLAYAGDIRLCRLVNSPESLKPVVVGEEVVEHTNPMTGVTRKSIHYKELKGKRKWLISEPIPLKEFMDKMESIFWPDWRNKIAEATEKMKKTEAARQKRIEKLKEKHRNKEIK